MKSYFKNFKIFVKYIAVRLCVVRTAGPTANIAGVLVIVELSGSWPDIRLRRKGGSREHVRLARHSVQIFLASRALRRVDLFPAGIHYWKTGSTGATQRDSLNRGTKRLGRVKG